MAKFVIECPHCGRFAEARTGFFARKKIDCACGYTIDVRTDKISARQCPHCGNTVVFDQSKGSQAKCPVCHEPINTISEQSKTEEFSCKQCGVRLITAKNAPTYTCPVCDFENDVPERLMAEKISKEGLASIIKYEGDNETLVWKHPIEDFNYGSQLIVHESQEAVFFRDGAALDLFGPGRYTLETQQLPIMEKLYRLPTDPEKTFHSEVYFINKTTQMGIKWGTDSKVRFFDPSTGMHLEIGASGEFNIRVVDSRKLLVKVVGTTGGIGQNELMGSGTGKGYFRAMVMTQVKSYLAQTIRENQINILEIDERLLQLSQALKVRLNQQLADYGLEMPEFFVGRVITPDEDPNFRRMKQQYADQYLKVREEQIRKAEAEAAQLRKQVEAQTEAQMKVIGAQGEAEALKLQAAAQAEAYKMQAAAEAEEMRMKGYTYQQETARQVGLEAMKNGLGGESGAGAIGNLAGLGIGIGAMGSVINMTKDALNPAMNAGKEMGQGMIPNNSPLGLTPECFDPHTPAPADQPLSDTWDCPACGTKNIKSKFCPECGMKRPEPQPAAPAGTWDCPVCGTKGIQSKFCPECGARRPEGPATWICPNCGTRDIKSKFCPECGMPKPAGL